VTTRSVILGSSKLVSAIVDEVVVADLAPKPVDESARNGTAMMPALLISTSTPSTLSAKRARRQVCRVELAAFPQCRSCRRRFVALVWRRTRRTLAPTRAQLTCGDITESTVGAGHDHGATGE